MHIVRLLLVASMPIIKVLMVTMVGVLLALDRVDILGDISRKNLNKLVYYVFNPALFGSSLAETITFENLHKLWFMPINVFLTNVAGTILGWILVKVTRAPKDLKGLVIGSCSGGNLSLPIIIIPAMCKEKGGPFGTPSACRSNGLAYASLAMALGAIFSWAYTYNIVRILTVGEERGENNEEYSNARPHLPSTNLEISRNEANTYPTTSVVHSSIPTTHWMNKFSPMQSLASSTNALVPSMAMLKNQITKTTKKMHLKELLSPSTIAVILGFIIGMISPFRHLLIGDNAILHVLDDSIYMIGDAAVPAMTLVLGASLLQGIRGSKIQLSIVVGIVAVRYILLPGLGVLIIRGAMHFGMVQHDPLFVFFLLFLHAMPPAMSISTITEMFGTGESEASVILMWTYALAPIFLTLWSAFYLWIAS